MLVGKKEDSLALSKGPFQDRFGVAAGTNNTAVPAAECFQASCAVDVRNGGQVFGVDHFAQLLPSGFHLANRCHVRHRAAGCHIGQYHPNAMAVAFFQLFRTIDQDICGLGHKVNATENNRPTVLAVRRHFAQLVRISI